ncbi:MAG: hypothetical protein K8S99_17645 [Planctomycetes bacterium]|nr:hypothetical protein [Planctomycetota bacterium]
MRPVNDPNPKIGAGHVSAMFRQGLRELRSALYPESNVAQTVPEYGLYGTKTPGEVAEDRRSEIPALEEERGSILADRMKQVEASREGRDAPAKEMERD